MADVRALLAAERQSRRISHPFLTYSKSGQLLCNVCNLNVKSEALWEGHLRSPNHRKNVIKASEEKGVKSLKRKLDDVDESGEEGPLPEDDLRKKPKSRAVSHAENNNPASINVSQDVGIRQVHKSVRFNVQEPPGQDTELPTREPPAQEQPPATDADNDEEMAAFEREIASLDEQPDYSAATITAAPVSAAELDQQDKEDKRKQLELVAEDEIDEEGRKLEDEFEAMEELEERINKLKKRREALRTVVPDTSAAPGHQSFTKPLLDPVEQQGHGSKDDDADDDDEDEVDDWYT